MRARIRPFVMISAARGSKDDLYNHSMLRTDIDALGLVKATAIGVYKGVKENSFMVHYDTLKELTQLIMLGKQYSQESILIVNEDSMGYIHTLNDLEPNVRHTIKSVGINELHNFDDYSEVPSLGMRFTLGRVLS